MKIDKHFNPTDKQTAAILHTLNLFADGYKLKDSSNQEFQIEATLDLFTGSFFSSLLDGLGDKNSYELKIGRDNKTRLRTILTISFYNPL